MAERHKPGIITVAQFCELQRLIGASGAQLARWLELNGETISRYRNGSTRIPGPVAFGMRALASGYRP